MYLQNRFYTILDERQEANGESIFRICFDASHPIFTGHFPGHPIVPGACLVQIAEELTARLTGRKGSFTQVRNLKFRQPVTPDQELTFAIQEKASSYVKHTLCILHSDIYVPLYRRTITPGRFSMWFVACISRCAISL